MRIHTLAAAQHTNTLHNKQINDKVMLHSVGYWDQQTKQFIDMSIMKSVYQSTSTAHKRKK